MDAFQILVIILSVFLTVALILTIVTLVYVLKTAQYIKNISQKAAAVVDSASNVSKFVNPAVAGKYIYDAVVKATNSNKKEK